MQMPVTAPPPRASNMRDNHTRGNVGEFLRERIRARLALSFVTAYFTIYGYAALRRKLERIERIFVCSSASRDLSGRSTR